MTTKTGWMIYGANGYTGRLVAKEALALGERPLLAGRSAEKVRRVADELGLPWVAFDLGDRAAAVAALRGVELVLLAAGPFDGLAHHGGSGGARRRRNSACAGRGRSRRCDGARRRVRRFTP